MVLLLLKWAACLTVLIIFYKLFLEHLAVHTFKRFYLLGALVVSIVIPFITFVEYIEPVYTFGNFDINGLGTPPYFPADIIIIETPEVTNYWPIILWSIYGLGVVIFASKFCVNLFKIISKINNNEKQKQSGFVSVLLQDLIIPHTFLNYIFLNKRRFEIKAIPSEILLHEATHVKQKHTLDILFIEFLQVVFWFNPLLYIIKKDIKLNHEFLADQAVLRQGIKPSVYQQLLLEFSSSSSTNQLANAINYSLIKKRFTIMKTQTSKKAIWLRSLVLLPLLGALLFSFSSREQVEKEMVPEMIKNVENTRITKESNIPVLRVNNNPLMLTLNDHRTSFETLKTDFTRITNGEKSNLSIVATGAVDFNLIKKIGATISKDYLLKIKLSEGAYVEDKTDYSVNKNPILIVNGLQCIGCSLKFTKTQAKDLILSTNTKDEIKSFKIKVPKKPTQTIKGNTLNKVVKDYIDQASFEHTITVFDIKTVSDKKLKTFTINLVNPKAILPPPPPPTMVSVYKNGKRKTLNEIIKDTPKGVESGYESLNGEIHYFIVNNGEKTYFNKDSYITDKNGKILPPPPPPPAPMPPPIPVDATPEQRNKMQKATDEYKKRQVINSPTPRTTLDHVVGMVKKGASFYFDGDKITSDKAIELLKKDKELNISTQNISSKNPIVNITSNPVITDDKGKVITKVESLANVKKYSGKDKEGYVKLNDKVHFYSIKNNEITIFNRFGKKMNDNGEAIEKNNTCLNVPNTINFSIQNTTLNISCIEQYPKNKLSIYNRWGNLIYTKDAYNNTWDGTVDIKEAKNVSAKAQIGTYYYVLETGIGKNALNGYLYVTK